jgi:hypothetical protein
MSTPPNWPRYLSSLSAELQCQSDRVRDLIGDKHWYSDGHHKEYLLLSLLQRHLPAGMRACRGFVISALNPKAISREQDVLIIDTTLETPVFDQNNLVVAFPTIVRAAISVKTTLTRTELKDCLKGLGSVRRVAALQATSPSIWTGVFAFRRPTTRSDYKADIKKMLAAKQVADATSGSRSKKPLPCPDAVCTADGILIKCDGGSEALPAIRLFESPQLATAAFLHELIIHLARSRGAETTQFGEFADWAWDEHSAS